MRSTAVTAISFLTIHSNALLKLDILLFVLQIHLVHIIGVITKEEILPWKQTNTTKQVSVSFLFLSNDELVYTLKQNDFPLYCDPLWNKKLTETKWFSFVLRSTLKETRMETKKLSCPFRFFALISFLHFFHSFGFSQSESSLFFLILF